MTNQQITMAIEMNKAGIAWKTITNHFKVSEKDLRTKRKLYYETNKPNTE